MNSASIKRAARRPAQAQQHVSNVAAHLQQQRHAQQQQQQKKKQAQVSTAVDVLWPGGAAGPAMLKRAAALALSQRPSYSALDEDLSSQLKEQGITCQAAGVSAGLQELLCSTPCFLCQRSREMGGWTLQLNVEFLLQSAKQQVAAAIDAVWPQQAAGITARQRAAALILLQTPGLRSRAALLAQQLVQQGLKCESETVSCTVRNLSAAQPKGCFDSAGGRSKFEVQLVTARLLQAAAQQQEQQWQQEQQQQGQQQQREQQQVMSKKPPCLAGPVRAPSQQQRAMPQQQQTPAALQPQAQQVYELQLQYVAAEATFHAALLPLVGSEPVLGVMSSSAAAAATRASDGAAAAADESAEDAAVASLMALLPKRVQSHVRQYLPAARQPCLMQLQADAGCALQARLSDGTTHELPVILDIDKALKRLAAAKQQASSGSAAGQLFGSDNRTGVPGTLHRICTIRGRQGSVQGLTYRVGRHLPGVGLLLADVLACMKRSIRGEGAERPQSLLLLGKPGVGKTTLLRDIARIMSLPPSQGGLGLAVIVVDTSNEIGGEAEQRHACIGHARRMMVPSRQQQAQVLLEAVQNHAPDVVIIDEIGTREEAAAAKTISQRGVLLVGTAHGSSLGSLLRNSELSPLVGGITSVTLGDQQARESNRGSKTRLERLGAATFVTLVEIHEKNRMRLHLDVERSVDSMLAAAAPQQHCTTATGNGPLPGEAVALDGVHLRSRCARSGRLLVHFEGRAAAAAAAAGTPTLTPHQPSSVLGTAPQPLGSQRTNVQLAPGAPVTAGGSAPAAVVEKRKLGGRAGRGSKRQQKHYWQRQHKKKKLKNTTKGSAKHHWF